MPRLRAHAAAALTTLALTVTALQFTAAPVSADSSHLFASTGTPESGPHDVDVRLELPSSVVDGHPIRLRVVALSRLDGAPVEGAQAQLQRRTAGKNTRWKTLSATTVSASGEVLFEDTPRETSKYRVLVSEGEWFESATSLTAKVRNLPQGEPVVLPPRAPKPRKLPRQSRAETLDADASVTPIPNKVWREMRGVSWRRGCTPRSRLRLVSVNHYGFDGYRYRGELVVAKDVARQVAAAFTEIHDAQLPIRAMYRVERFGYSKALRGADDYASMAADNTSAFNCREVVGRQGVVSNHSSGRAIDINPFENPYHSPRDGWLPRPWWTTRSDPRVAWRSKDHAMVRLLASHGIGWTYGVKDAHHFQVSRSSGATQPWAGTTR